MKNYSNNNHRIISDISKVSSEKGNDIIKEPIIEVENKGISQKITLAADEISWQAPEYEYEPKTVSWYWISLIISIILIAIALWQRNFLFVVFIVIAELILIYFSNRVPKIWDFRINNEGILIGETKIYKYENIKGFDIHPAGDNYKELVFHTDLKLNPYIKIFIASDNEKRIEEKLLEFIKREEISPSLVDTLGEIVRF